jgi:hypothetical protein
MGINVTARLVVSREVVIVVGLLLPVGQAHRYHAFQRENPEAGRFRRGMRAADRTRMRSSSTAMAVAEFFLP